MPTSCALPAPSPRTASPASVRLAPLLAALLAALGSAAQACADCAEHLPAAAATPAPDAARIAEDASPDSASAAPQRRLGLVTVRGTASTSLPTVIPTTLEGLTAADIARSINATDAEDALKYLPSLLVRKRYPGDYNHAVLSSRASGTGNSARSLVYVDGIPLANLLGNGAAFTPRWGLVDPEEIARVDVLYGPFSAAYSGNSVGAVVDYQTHRPQGPEAHAEMGAYQQAWDLYGQQASYQGRSVSASVGNRWGDWDGWLSLARHDNQGQPLTYATRLLSQGTAPAVGAVIVSGAVAGQDKSFQPWWLLGSGTQMHTVQDQAKARVGLQLTSELRAQALLGLWRNHATATSESWLRDTAGNAVYSGAVSIDGRGYTLAPADFSLTQDDAEHRILGATLRHSGANGLGWELAASQYDYLRDRSTQSLTAQPQAQAGGAGRMTTLDGTGWTTLSAKASTQAGAAHALEFGWQHEHYRWRQRLDNAADWRQPDSLTPFTAFSGETALTSAFAQDAITLGSGLQAVLGLRHESWGASHGSKTAFTGQRVSFADRQERHLSPKAALGWQAGDSLDLRVSVGRAVRMPTVSELYQGGVSSSGAYVEGDPATNPGLKPEQGWTRELSALWSRGTAELRATLFHENTRDALYSQVAVVDGRNLTSVQNIGRIETLGLELAGKARPVPGLRAQASLTYADSTIKANDGFVTTPGDTLGKQQPRVPRWRASLLASYALTAGLDASLGARYGGRQWGQLNNSDGNGFAYQGFSSYFSTDLRLRWQLDRQWRLAAGVDNLNNARYWNFHPYAARTLSGSLHVDL